MPVRYSKFHGSTTTTTATASSPAGRYTITAAVGAPTAANYSFTFVNGTVTITQAAPVISWAAPAAMVYGTPLSEVQLDATTSVGGTFAYTPATGTLLSAGTLTLSVVFTPTDANDYTTASARVSLIVSQASGATNLTFGANPALLGAQITFTASVTSSFGVPSGSAAFSDGGTTLGSGDMNEAGIASHSISAPHRACIRSPQLTPAPQTIFPPYPRRSRRECSSLQPWQSLPAAARHRSAR